MGDHEIGDRLTKLEVQVVEKWAAHDKRSDERWADLMEKFHELSKKMGTLPCEGNLRNTLDLCHRTKSLEDWKNVVNWAIGVVYVSLVGIVLTKVLT
jgi:hypothetical protein